MLHYYRFGRGPSLILLHGFMGGIGMWLPQLASFKEQYDVIAIDLPGFSKSSSIQAPNSLAGFSTLIVDLLDSINVNKFSILGFSMGGMIAQQMAKDYGKYVQAMILYSSSAIGNLPHRFETWEDSILRINQSGVDLTANNTIAKWFIDGENSPYYKICREACSGANLNSCITTMRAMQQWCSIDWLGQVKTSSLVIAGDRDKSTNISDALVLFENLSNSELCILPGCAHGANLEKPDLFNSVVLNFLNSTFL